MKYLNLIISCLILFVSSIQAQKVAPEGGKEYVLEKSLRTTTPVTSWYSGGENAIAIEKGEVRWLPDDAKSVLSLPGGYLKTVFSNGGHYFALLSLQKQPDNAGGNKTLEVAVYDSTGHLRHSLNMTQYYDEPYPVVALSDRDGALVLARITTGEVSFYDGDGTLTRKVELLPHSDYDLERIIHLDINKAGSTVAVAATRHGLKPLQTGSAMLSGEPYLFRFDADGKEVWRKTIAGAMVSSVSVSPDGNRIAAGSYTLDERHRMTPQSVVYDRDGRPQLQAGFLFHDASWSANSGRLLLANHRSAALLDLQSGSISWEKSISSQKDIIAAAGLSADGQTAALLIAENEFKENRFVFIRPFIEVLNGGGVRLQKIDLSGQEFVEPALSISADGRLISAGFINSYQIYRVK